MRRGNMMEDKLWSVTEHKMRTIREYVESLCDPNRCHVINNKDILGVKCVNCKIWKALQLNNPTEILEAVGYE